MQACHMVKPLDGRQTNSAAYPLMECFASIQGEGHHSGMPAVFIRLAGCDIGCHWCDTKTSWDMHLHPMTTTDVILDKVLDKQLPNVVVTGGEPAMHDLNPLSEALKSRRLATYLESSGALALSGSWDWICVSPKKNAPPKKENLIMANELKVVVFNRSDIKWAEHNASQVGKNCMLYLQPEWSVRNAMIPFIVDYIHKNPRWKMTLQMHKYAGLP